MLICVIVPRNIQRKFLAGFLTGLYDQSHRCDRVRVGRSDLVFLFPISYSCNAILLLHFRVACDNYYVTLFIVPYLTVPV